jgi:hypothetical protein
MLAMLLAGPLALVGQAALREFELQRELANRTQCAPGLKEIGLAVHNYHDPSRRPLNPKTEPPR